MRYQPVTEAGKKSQAELQGIINETVSAGGARMDQAVKSVVDGFKDDLSELIAEATDELDRLKGRLEQLKQVDNQDTSVLVKLTEDCVITLNKREENLKRVGAIAVSAMKKAAGIPG